ncbi:MAG: zinc ribbon domain-containing protein [Anaerolineales bacterium]|nr:zinc ribbon domain-containing protein [Anaerolineales bacterium]
MPIYEYSCQECETRFDKFVRSMSAEDEVTCPSCGSKQVRRGFSTFASRGDSGFSVNPAPSNCAPSG